MSPTEFESFLGTELGTWELFEEYPEVLRSVIVALEDWLSYIVEVLDHIAEDESSLRDVYSLHRNERISGIYFAGGDAHGGGRRVVRVAFESRNIFYKPTDGELHNLLPELKKIIPEAFAHIFIPEVLLRDGYFWVAEVESRVRPHQASNLSSGLGSLTAISYFLRSIDLHHENIRFVDGKVCVTDVETLVHGAIPQPPVDNEYGNAATQWFANSVASIGILPNPVAAAHDHPDRLTDISTLGAKSGQEGGPSVPQPVEGEDGHVRLAMVSGVFDDEQELPERPILLQYRQEFLESFEHTFKLIVKRNRLIAQVVSDLSDVRARFLARPTMVYGKIIAEMNHPEFTRDYMGRVLCSSKLLSRFYGRDYRARLVASEICDVMDGNVPRFEMTIGQGAIFNDRGEHIGYTDAPLPDVMRRLECCSDKDLVEQKAIIEHCWATAYVDNTSDSCPSQSFSISSSYLTSSSLDRELLADSLLGSLHISDDGFAVPLALRAQYRGQWRLGTGGVDLYDALPVYY
ncbi:DUF4135 domain-containing protein [Corynebacterium sp. CNJ-954]|uniref:DUF4135 domain-containing protein n=1 Tax=Corynebacterium sp. CNJ-954 TaxID=1904962 RepID=UPI00096A2788|nr:DUF4135 domain-containing protein [Corynebacterium sp. CNJ-954]